MFKNGAIFVVMHGLLNKYGGGGGGIRVGYNTYHICLDISEKYDISEYFFLLCDH